MSVDFFVFNKILSVLKIVLNKNVVSVDILFYVKEIQKLTSKGFIFFKQQK